MSENRKIFTHEKQKNLFYTIQACPTGEKKTFYFTASMISQNFHNVN